MSEAPERIWAFPKNDWFNAGASTYKIKAAGAKDVEYIRADLVEAAVKRALEGVFEVVRYHAMRSGTAADVLRDPSIDPAKFIDGEK